MNGQGAVEKVVDQTEHDQISAHIARVNDTIRKLINDITVLADYMYGETAEPSTAKEVASPAPQPGIMGQVSNDIRLTLALVREADEAFKRLRR